MSQYKQSQILITSLLFIAIVSMNTSNLREDYWVKQQRLIIYSPHAHGVGSATHNILHICMRKVGNVEKNLQVMHKLTLDSMDKKIFEGTFGFMHLYLTKDLVERFHISCN